MPSGGSLTASGWRVDGEGRLKREAKPSMLRRCSAHDYCERSIYQITLTLADRRGEPLGRLMVNTRPRTGEHQTGDGEAGGVAGAAGEGAAVGARQGGGSAGGWVSVAEAKGLGLKPDEVAAKVEPTAAGLAALEALREMPRLCHEVEIIGCQLMPDHLHFIVFVKSRLTRPLGALIRGFKAGASKRWNSLKNERAPDRGESGPTPSRGGGLVPANSFAGCPKWAEGYQDTILRGRGQLEHMFNYLRDNPRRRAIKALFPGLFKVVSELKVEFKNSPDNGQSSEDSLKNERAPNPRAPDYGWFSALGNRFLLKLPLAQAQVSRSFFGYKRVEERKADGSFIKKIARDAAGAPIVEFATREFEETRDRLFALAKAGQVIFSPCVSDGEREIARLALEARINLIALKNKGFSPLEKPTGRYFDACSDGRLLLLAPAAWPYQPGEKKMTRFDATALNRLAQWIAGEGAAECNYHGMRPANIDELAAVAVRKAE